MISQTAAIIQFSSVGVKYQDKCPRELLIKLPGSFRSRSQCGKGAGDCWFSIRLKSITSGKLETFDNACTRLMIVNSG
jgi:hypothetical protein